MSSKTLLWYFSLCFVKCLKKIYHNKKNQKLNYSELSQQECQNLYEKSGDWFQYRGGFNRRCPCDKSKSSCVSKLKKVRINTMRLH